MIWMGIALRCLLLLFNFVMFRYVLGYEIREKACWPLVALTAAAAVLLPVMFPNWFSGYRSSNLIMGQSFFAHLKSEWFSHMLYAGIRSTVFSWVSQRPFCNLIET